MGPNGLLVGPTSRSPFNSRAVSLSLSLSILFSYFFGSIYREREIVISEEEKEVISLSTRGRELTREYAVGLSFLASCGPTLNILIA